MPRRSTFSAVCVAVLACRIVATPYAKKLAKDLGVDLATIAGTGPAGRITAADVENAKAGRAPAPAAPAPGEQMVASLAAAACRVLPPSNAGGLQRKGPCFSEYRADSRGWGAGGMSSSSAAAGSVQGRGGDRLGDRRTGHASCSAPRYSQPLQ